MCTPRATTVSGFLSMVMTFFAPSSSAAMVAQQPPRPAPTTSTSQSSVFVILSAGMSSGAISQLCMPATSGPAEAPLSATGMPPVAPAVEALPASAEPCGAQPASPATAAPASAVPPRPKNARRERPCFFSSSMSDSLLRCLLAAPCCRVAPTIRPTSQVIIPSTGGTSPPLPDFPLPGGCFSHGRRGKG